MVSSFWLGMAIIFASGSLNGSFAVPMKLCRLWRWENIWLFFNSLALLVLFPLFAFLLIPDLMGVYSAVPASAIVYPALFGLLWGVTQVTFGLGIEAVGIAIAFAVVSGLVSVSGSLTPLLLLSPEDLFRPRGILLLVSLPVLLAGLYLYGLAGKRREQEQALPESSNRRPRSFASGMAICVFTGIVGSSYNLGFALSGDIIRLGVAHGASPLTATFASWALVLGAGYLPCLLYCGYLLFRNRTWPNYVRRGSARDAALIVIMTVMWFAAVSIYGFGATRVGKYGTSVGFTVFVAMSILAANALGSATGEWKTTSRQTRRLMHRGIALVLGSVVTLNLGGLFA
jgi:L-rhamnose-H+ transport protein